MKSKEAVQAQKPAYVAPTLQKQQLIEEVLGQFTVTTSTSHPS